jgi:ribosome-binding factor A
MEKNTLNLYDALKKPTHRKERISKQIQQLIARAIQRQEVPLFLDDDGNYVSVDTQVSITAVQMGPDLKHATIYVRPLIENDNFDVLIKQYNGVSYYFRKHIAQELRLRFAPQILFLKDDHVERIERLEHMIDQSK